MRTGIIVFLAFLTVVLGDSHIATCPHDQFVSENNTCEPCDQQCLDKGFGCKGPGLDGCLFVCPIFREDPIAVPLFEKGIRIHDEDHNQIHKMTKAEFYLEDFESFSDSMYVSLTVDTTGTEIEADYNAVEGKLTLTGSDFVSNYDKALGSIKFQNNAPTPDLKSREVAFRINDGDQWSEYFAVAVAIAPINNHPPVITVTPAEQTYQEHGAPVDIFNSVDIQDQDHEAIFPMRGATISVMSPPSGDCFGDQLITVELGSYADKVSLDTANPAEVIHLVGDASADVYEHIIKTAKFHSTGPEPPRGSVRINVEIDDGDFTDNADVIIEIETINDSPPKIEDTGGLPSFVARDENAVTIAETISLIDCDDNDVHKWKRLEVMVMTRTSDFPDETLDINIGNFQEIDKDEVAKQHIILVPSNNKAEAPVAQFQGALRTLTYYNANENISCPLERQVRLRVWDGIHMTEKNITVAIDKSNKNVPNLGVTTETGKSFTEDGPPVALLKGVQITDLDKICDLLLMEGAEVNMTAPDGEYENITFTQHKNIAVKYPPVDIGNSTWQWTVTGNAPAQEYEDFIQSIRYQNKEDEPDMTLRTVWIRIFDGMFYSNPVEIDIEMKSRNDQPPKLISPLGMVYNFTENEGPAVLCDYLEDDDSEEIDRRVNTINVWIHNISSVDGDDEILHVNENTTTLPADITVTRVSSSSVEIKGSDNGNLIPEFNAVLQTLGYSNARDEPTPGRRRIRFQIFSNAIGAAREVNVYLYVDVFGVNDSPTMVALPGYVNYTERAGPVHVAPNAMLRDADKQPVNVTIMSINVSFVLDHEPGGRIYCNGCPNVTVTHNRLMADFGGQGWLPQKVAELVRNITFAIVRAEPPRLADAVEVTFEITDIDGILGSTTVPIRVQHICDPGTLILNGVASMSKANFSEFTPDEWVPIVEGPVNITNNDSNYIVEAEINITKNHDADHDELQIVDSSHSSAMSTNGLLRIEGMKSLEQMEDIISKLSFRNRYECRNRKQRTVEISLKDDCGAWSNIGTVIISIIEENDPPIVSPAEGSRDPLEYTYIVQGIRNLNPPMLAVFPRLEVIDCDGPDQDNLTMINVTIMDAPDWPYEKIVFNETMLSETGLHVKALEVNEHVVRYMIYHPNGTAPISWFVSVIRHSYYINSADCPFEVARKIIVTAIDGEDSGEGYAMINFHRNPVGPQLMWNESIVRQWTSQATNFYLLEDPSFGIIPGDIHFIHKALVSITNPIQSQITVNFKDLVFIDGVDETSFKSLGLKMTPNLPQRTSEIMFEFNGPVSSVDAAKFEGVLRTVKFSSGDIEKNCDRIIAVTVWDSPLKRKSNTIYVKVIVGDRPEPIGCNATEAPTTDEPTTMPPTTPTPTTEEVTKKPTEEVTFPPEPTTEGVTTEGPTEVVTFPPEPTTEGATTDEPTEEISFSPEPTTGTEDPTESLVDCSEGSKTLASQADVDALGATGCNQINGDLVINCGFDNDCFSPFFSLVNLRNIKVVTGKLRIMTNRMKTLEGLENIKSFASVELNDNTELVTMKHLRMNTYEQEIKVSEISMMGGHSRLEDIDGLKGITEVTGGNVLFANLPSLKSLAGLSHLRKVCKSDGTGDFTLEKINEGSGGEVVENLGHLSSLQQVCGVLKVYVTKVTTLEGLSSLTKVGSIQVRSNDHLSSAENGLSAVEVITGVRASTQGGYSVLIYGNPSLTTMGDFAKANGALNSVKGKVRIGSNSKLCSPANMFSLQFWIGLGATEDGSNPAKGTDCAKRRRK
eukprot:m.248008 g.248008  ORF g.248008 m.248008 type:complete len:1771 (+) comp40281_c0_seq6:496-5808(+)